VRRIVTLGIQIVGDDLGVQIVGDRDIVVTCPDSGFSITYRKDSLAPMLVAIEDIGRRDPSPSELKFWAQAWKAAREQARAVGWLRS
jgi:hypothetical protein